MAVLDGDYRPTTTDVQILRQWLKKMPHLIQDYDDDFLALFIKAKKGSLNKAKIVLEKLNSAGLSYPDFFDHVDVLNPKTQKCLKETRVFPLPKRLDNGAYVFVSICDFKDNNSTKSNITEMWRYWFMLFHVINWENHDYFKNITIFDWKNLRLGNAKELNPVYLARMIESLQIYPLRVLAVYNINVPPALEWVLNMIKSVASKKLADRFHFMSSIETLYQSVPREILPKDYGGNEDDIKTMHNRWMKKVKSYRDRLVDDHVKMRKLDPLRPKGEDAQDMVGTFKSLTVD